jgi:hypothetical protein
MDRILYSVDATPPQLNPKDETLVPQTIFDVRDFGAQLNGVTDDTAAFQIAINAAQAATGNWTATRGEVYCPPGLVFRTTTALLLNSKPIRLDIRSPQLYDCAAGAAWVFNGSPVVGQSQYWDVDMEGIDGLPSVPAFPGAINPYGNTAIVIRNMTFSRFKVWHVIGFSNVGIDLDGSGAYYGNQVIQHNHFQFGQIANCGLGIRAISAHAATSSVEANRIEAMNVYQNFCNYNDGYGGRTASTSNTIYFNAMDNCSPNGIGMDLWSSYNNIYVGFTGRAGGGQLCTSLLLRPGSRKNRIRIGNDPSTDLVVNDQSGGQNTVEWMP